MKGTGRGGGGGGGSGYTGRTTKIFVGGLPNDANNDNLKSYFSRFGEVGVWHLFNKKKRLAYL